MLDLLQTSELRALRLSFSENDAFLFSGLKLFHFRLPPGFSHTLAFNLLPIRTGRVPLPTPRLFDVTSGCEVLDPEAKHVAYVHSVAVESAWERPQPPAIEEGERQVV